MLAIFKAIFKLINSIEIINKNKNKKHKKNILLPLLSVNIKIYTKDSY